MFIRSVRRIQLDCVTRGEYREERSSSYRVAIKKVCVMDAKQFLSFKSDTVNLFSREIDVSSFIL